MKQTNNNWKNLLVIGMLTSGSIVAGCKNSNSDYKTIDSPAQSGDAITMDSTQGNVVDESMNPHDNTSVVPADANAPDRNSSMANGANSATGSKMVEPENKAASSKISTRPVRKAKYRYGVNWTAMNANNSTKAIRDVDGVYSRAEVMPMYPGGEEALRKFVEDNVEYPEDAVQEGNEGEVKVVFTINENGKVSNAKVMSDNVDTQLEQEAKDAVARMPAWTPGKVNGKAVKTRLTLPITYKIIE